MNDLIYNDDLFTPGSKAAKENPRLGIVVMDFVNKQLCRRIIDRNAFPSSAAMKVGTVTADGETQTAEQTPFLSAFAEMPLSDGITATAAPMENVSAPPVPAEDAPAPTENVTAFPAPMENAPAPTEGVTAPPRSHGRYAYAHGRRDRSPRTHRVRRDRLAGGGGADLRLCAGRGGTALCG